MRIWMLFPTHAEPTDRSPVASLLPVRGRASERRGLERGPSARRLCLGDAHRYRCSPSRVLHTASLDRTWTPPRGLRIPRSVSEHRQVQIRVTMADTAEGTRSFRTLLLVSRRQRLCESRHWHFDDPLGVACSTRGREGPVGGADRVLEGGR